MTYFKNLGSLNSPNSKKLLSLTEKGIRPSFPDVFYGKGVHHLFLIFTCSDFRQNTFYSLLENCFHCNLPSCMNRLNTF